MTTRTSLRAFARELKVSHTSVVKAVRAGRLRRSLGHDARGPYVKDVIAARKEWGAERARPTPAPAKVSTSKRARKGAADVSLTDVQKRVGLARAVQLEIRNRVSSGELIDARQEDRRDFQCARTVRDSILNIPERISGVIAAESDPARVHALLTAELTKALSSLAEIFERGDTR